MVEYRHPEYMIERRLGRTNAVTKLSPRSPRAVVSDESRKPANRLWRIRAKKLAQACEPEFPAALLYEESRC